MIIMLVKDVLVNYQFVQDLLQCYPCYSVLGGVTLSSLGGAGSDVVLML